jgi:hypothetical protein
MDKDLLWSFKMVLLDHLEESEFLRESLTLNEDQKFRNFIKSLTLEQVMTILELTKEEEGPFKYDVDSSKSLGELGDELKSVLGKHSGGENSKIFSQFIKDPKLKKRIEDVGVKKTVEELKIRQKIGSRLGIKTRIAIGLGVATLLAIGAYFIYKRFKDQCRTQCRTSQVPNCLKKCRISAAKASISRLQGTRSACGADQKCIADKELKKWQAKLVKIEREGISWGVVKQLKQTTGRPAPPPSRPSSYTAGSKKVIVYSTPRTTLPRA